MLTRTSVRTFRVDQAGQVFGGTASNREQTVRMSHASPLCHVVSRVSQPSVHVVSVRMGYENGNRWDTIGAIKTLWEVRERLWLGVSF